MARLRGYDPDTLLDGGGGPDSLTGGDGDDTITGQGGNDILYGDQGALSVGPFSGVAAIEALLQAGDGYAPRDFGSWGLLYQNGTRFGSPQDYNAVDLRDAPHDLLIIGASSTLDSTVASSEQLWTGAQIDTIQSGGSEAVLYLSVARINDYQTNWNAGWTTTGFAQGAASGSAPAWFGAADPVFTNARRAEFETTEWADLLKLRITALLQTGADGLFFDDVAAYFDFALAEETDGTAAFYALVGANARAMRDLIADLSDHIDDELIRLRGLGQDVPLPEDFTLIVNGDPYILQNALIGGDGMFPTGAELAALPTSPEALAYYGAVDAMMLENYLSRGLTAAMDQATQFYAQDGDIVLLALDAEPDGIEARLQLTLDAIDRGYVPFVTERDSYDTLNRDFISELLAYQNASGDDSLLGGAGDDEVHGGGGTDWVAGGAGNDTLSGGGNRDTLVGNSGNDVIDGGSNFDTVFYRGTPGAVFVNLQAGTAIGGAGTDTLANIENVIGGYGSDVIYGTRLHDNRIEGELGSDRLYGLEGADSLLGGVGDDSLYGSTDDDWLYGGDGDDSLLGGSGTDRLYGGRHNDWIEGESGADVLSGESGRDTLNGGTGDDTLLGGTNFDTLSYTGIFAPVLVNLENDSVSGGGGADVISGFENIIGSASHDTLYGTNLHGNRIEANLGNDTLYGLAGADTLLGRDGNDRIYGGTGNDLVLGDNGADYIEGGAGRDIATGGSGADNFVFRAVSDLGTGLAAGARDEIRDFNAAEGDVINLFLIDANSVAAGNQAFVAAPSGFTGTPGEVTLVIDTQFATRTFISLDVDGDGLSDADLYVVGVVGYEDLIL